MGHVSRERISNADTGGGGDDEDKVDRMDTSGGGDGGDGGDGGGEGLALRQMIDMPAGLAHVVLPPSP